MSALHFSPRPNRAAEINWQPWGKEAFELATSENKPVLLAISAVWCHWCHVMDETSYSSSPVIDTINQRFIPVRVDNDQRPDVNARYNMGGWPSTVFLTGAGEVLYGATYLPPDVMLQVLKQVDSFYIDPNNRLAVAQRSSEVKTARASRARSPKGGELDPQTAATVLATLSSAFDEEYGGFGEDQKFPHAPALSFLLDTFARARDARAKVMVQKTLRAMAEGGMYDHVEGGFFRYSTTRDFSVPHFEKMLEDLAGLLYVCARAGTMFGDDKLLAVAVDVKRYMDEHLWNAKFEAYGGSQDADEEYYQKDADERAQLQAPYVDPTVYTSWNASAARSLLLSAPLLESATADPAMWTHRGVKILETLWNRVFDHGLMCRYYDGTPHVRGLLVDQIWSAWAALAAFATTAQERWLERAADLIEHTDVLYDQNAQVYLDRLTSDDDVARVVEQTVSLEENSLMARVLVEYGALSGKTAYADRALSLLRRYSRDYQGFGLFAAPYASAVLDVTETPTDAYIVGSKQNPRAEALRIAALRVTVPLLRPNPIDPIADPSRASLLGYDTDEVAAYLCRNKTCFARATTPSEFAAALEARASI